MFDQPDEPAHHPSARKSAVKLLPLPAGPYKPSFSAALSSCGFWKEGMVRDLSRSRWRGKKAGCHARGPQVRCVGVSGYCLRANLPRSVLTNRASAPLVASSRSMAEYNVAAGVLPHREIQ